jgi:hypothetical protein
MKKNHIINRETGKTYCGIVPNQSIATAVFDNGEWYDTFAGPIDASNYNEALCVNCMKNYDVDLIDQFETDAFMIDYRNRIPNGKRAMKFFKRQSKLSRLRLKKDIQSTPAIESTPAETPIKKDVQSKPAKPYSAETINQSDKGKARKERKANREANQSKATESKCVIVDKPKPIEKKDPIIELTEEVKKPLIDLSNGPVTIETEELIDAPNDWKFGDPVPEDVIELGIGDDWRLIRHDEKTDQWQFEQRQAIKGIPQWISDGEWIDYKDAAELINDGFCG